MVKSVLEEAQKRKAKRVLEVYLIIGKISFLGIEQVKFAYDVLVKDTIMDGSKLFIEEKDGQIKCTNCNYEGRINCEDGSLHHISVIPTLTLRCPKCEGEVEIVGGKGCIIKSVKLML